MAPLALPDWLTVEESARLLYAIFPNYPVIHPCRQAPPREEWLSADNSPDAHAPIAEDEACCCV